MKARKQKVQFNLNDNDDNSDNELERNINNDSELNKVSKGEYIEQFSNILYWCGSFAIRTLIILFKTSGLYLLWICLHYFSSHLYVKFCVPNTLYGFIMSPFMITTPHCQGLRWIVYNAANVINNMWLLIGAWIYSLIWIINKDNNQEST